jgi:hypothetical protein
VLSGLQPYLPTGGDALHNYLLNQMRRNSNEWIQEFWNKVRCPCFACLAVP